MAHIHPDDPGVPELVNQPTAKPTRKVTAGAVGGIGFGAAAGPFIAWLVETGFGVEMPVEAAVSLGGILATTGGFIAAYLTRERDTPEAVGT